MAAIEPDITDLCDDLSDYGSEIDQNELSKLLSQSEFQAFDDDVVLTAIEQDPVTEHATIHLHSSGQPVLESIPHSTVVEATVTFATTIDNHSTLQHLSATPVQRTESFPPVDESRSPLERFRTHPKKPLSVTDIVTPAWCEQQYLFSLSKHGRVRRTPAMKQGSAVHKTLEEQVYTTVRIEVQSREDMFGLKLWNVIQGLRSLQQTGLTRELEVWGLLDGQVVNGVIDVVTSVSPDPAYEDKLMQRLEGRQRPNKKPVKLEANQTTLTGFMTSQDENEQDDPMPHVTYYVTDVKTRQTRTVPADDIRLRGTQMQLMLYHRLLTALSAGQVDNAVLFDRYNLDGSVTFSDTFIAEIAKLDLDAYDVRQDSVTELLEHNSLNSLWSHMVGEFGKTLAGPHASLSNMLTAEFRSGADGTRLGTRSFEFSAARLDAYVQDELSWWKGERPTKGVEIEEAFKCRICEFAADCPWRISKVEENLQKTRQKRTRTTVTVDAG